jgi:hypothetical protein
VDPAGIKSGITRQDNSLNCFPEEGDLGSLANRPGTRSGLPRNDEARMLRIEQDQPQIRTSARNLRPKLFHGIPR